ncbi:MAG: Gfo/Idh/MocA family oxidoreductase [bacterium]|nr:Gfo/Idh/MocA family oxidoreductase [bacterium]MDD4153519.1 Gfo/Idh/MocA family oxidoreductase [bacterium]
MLKLAFMGFRHGHILSLYDHAVQNEDVVIAGSCEEDAQTAAQLRQGGRVELTHDNYGRMLDEVDCDAVAIGDYYGKRGAIAIEALKRDKHVISDKPICTSLEELEEIASLSDRKGLKVGCQLDMRDNGKFQRIRELVQKGAIGDVHAVSVGGQHPLMFGTRPGWYFEKGKHGGTINDIGIHAVDMVPWITGISFVRVTAARAWNAFAAEVPYFNDAGQFMLEMANGCGVLGDVSYFMPDSMGYRLPQYWRTTLWGREGVIEASYNTPQISLAQNGNQEVEMIAPGEGTPGGYLRSFIAEIKGDKGTVSLSTTEVIRSSRITLKIQQAADQGLCNIAL